jgi:hypothetical protein
MAAFGGFFVGASNIDSGTDTPAVCCAEFIWPSGMRAPIQATPPYEADSRFQLRQVPPSITWEWRRLAASRGAAMRPAPKVGRSPLRYRAALRPPQRPARSRRRIPRRTTKQVEPSWEVVDDFPDVVPVMPTEIKVIETYSAAFLGEALEPIESETKSDHANTAARDIE